MTAALSFTAPEALELAACHQDANWRPEACAACYTRHASSTMEEGVKLTLYVTLEVAPIRKKVVKLTSRPRMELIAMAHMLCTVY